jgi:hypothetical protein
MALMLVHASISGSVLLVLRSNNDQDPDDGTFDRQIGGRVEEDIHERIRTECALIL